MEALKFTPGPWYVHDGTRPREYKEGHTGTFDILNTECYQVGGKVMADVKPYGGNFPEREEAKANAYLIAAAPDLFEALQEWCADYEQYQKGEGLGEARTSEIYRKAKCAMNKATGKATATYFPVTNQ